MEPKYIIIAIVHILVAISHAVPIIETDPVHRYDHVDGDPRFRAYIYDESQRLEPPVPRAIGPPVYCDGCNDPIKHSMQVRSTPYVAPSPATSAVTAETDKCRLYPTIMACRYRRKSKMTR